MKIMLVDDDPIGLQGFALECGALKDVELLGSFTSPLEALAFAKTHRVDVALLDIDMPEMDGFTLYDELKRLRPEMIAVFVTCHDACAVRAIRKKADYIVFKPYDHAEIEDLLSRIRLLSARLNKTLTCHTFGRFEVFVGATPVVFRSAKAQELLALCVYRRGVPVTTAEIIDTLWPNYIGTVGTCSIFRYTVKQLVDTLKHYGAADSFVHERSLCYVRAERIDCDYFRFLSGDAEALTQFSGSFLREYSWAEKALYGLLRQKHG